ncbi:UNVERIFIED_CONTAM: hypothetical protein K2H54_051574 [Gekko kuhli]
MDSSVNTGPILMVASGAVEQLRKSQAPLGLRLQSAVIWFILSGTPDQGGTQSQVEARKASRGSCRNCRGRTRLLGTWRGSLT